MEEAALDCAHVEEAALDCAHVEVGREGK